MAHAQAALGTRAVRPGNPVYLRVTDPDRSTTPGLDQITVMEGQGDATFGPPQSLPLPAETSSIAFADMNSDSRPDILTVHYATWRIAIFYALEEGGFTEPELVPIR